MDQARFPDCVKLLDHLGLYLRDHAKVRILVISEMGEPLVDVNRWVEFMFSRLISFCNFFKVV